MLNSAVSYDDVQGLVRFGYAKLTEACYFLLQIKDRRSARAWLVSAPISTAVTLSHPPLRTLQVAFASEGLRTMGLPGGVLSQFSAEFIAGMAGEESRSRRLGDVGVSAPSAWRWGGGTNAPHVLLMLFAQPGLLEQWKETIKGPSWKGAFDIISCLSTSNLGGVEPFGFADGISQPEIDWNGERVLRSDDELAYGNLVALGEFLLGYPNEYGKYTDRPLIERSDDPSSLLLPAQDDPGKLDFARNGTYLVLRQLRQDVRAFWQYLDSQSGFNADRRRRLGEAMVGRTMGGDPLMPLTPGPIAGIGSDPEAIRLNRFTYTADPDGVRCPLGAHIRRANPRNPDLLYASNNFFSRLIHVLGFGRKHVRDDLIASARFHRILRRGREYGPGLLPEQAISPAPPDDLERGLHFICLNANIARQFEFVQNAWMMRAKFDGLSEESDPLLGNREPIRGCPSTDIFTIPQANGITRRMPSLPRFVTVVGGAYFFLPSMRALQYLATLPA
jgi:deferrochelatase/peroxidase EfeB